jgi:endonuclease/exonuclease/phosphatase family metal-dependent hydrolase
MPFDRIAMRRLILLCCLLTSALGAETLRVMSFNVRFPSPDDGDNRWEFRRDLLVATIREKDPDLLGTQELFFEQGEYIVGKLAGYAWFGLSRRGNREDEHMGVFYKKDRLRLLDSGNFWLSETPETPGSMSWDVSLPRMVTWGLFEVGAGGRRFYYYNTHFPHRPQDAAARLKCAGVIVERMNRLPKDVPFLMTGDFNSPAGGDVFKLFTAQLKDAWDTAVKRSGPEGTNSGFAGRTTGRRIDWILYRGPFRVLEAETVTRNEKGRYPSDHFPVIAALEF